MTEMSDNSYDSLDCISFEVRNKVTEAIKDPLSHVGPRFSIPREGILETMESWQARAAIRVFIDAQRDHDTACHTNPVTHEDRFRPSIAQLGFLLILAGFIGFALSPLRPHTWNPFPLLFLIVMLAGFWIITPRKRK